MSFSQTKISYFHDLKQDLNISNIDSVNFKTYNGPINQGLNNGVFWVKIENFKKEKSSYIVHVLNYKIVNTKGFQGNKELVKLTKERYPTYKTSSSAPIYLRVEAYREALIPIEVKTYSSLVNEEKNNFLFIGFYFGFAFITIVLNILYFLNLRRRIFILYSLFLASISVTIFVSDGMLSLLGYSENFISYMVATSHFLTFGFALLFSSNYMQINNYYPKVKYIGSFIFFIISVFYIMYLITNNFIYFVILESLGFLLFVIYWFTGVLLFRKNLFIKIFVVGYFFILVFATNFYYMKLFGFSDYFVSPFILKLGGFFEMTLLSFAVIYRMKILNDENYLMRSEILNYSKEVNSLSKELKMKTDITPLVDTNLSIRESEIFDFIVVGITNKEIADKLNISVNTVKFHVKNIYEKLNIKSRKEAKNLLKA
ncbi:LuxR C-terminal-related transcriptional regulator [Polaribacter sp. MSW13]|uniref:LuxR C-terminal-related transcriptional regulator n=1 Tax=Polaribacter marinus TaxID=2916838 RepID=A0A9X2AIG5_9FLAO|nr:LuxR C-terminal-related transcriptional regulator [Polaribacter marinus]